MKRYLGVREWSYDCNSLFGSQQHNINEEYRKSLGNVIRPEETKNNILINGDVNLQEHIQMIDEYNSQFTPKSRNRIEHLREQDRNYYFDTATTQKLLSKDYNPNMENHIKTTKPIKWIGNKGAFEQVLYFSNTINDEDLNDDDWKFIMNQWAKHMKSKYGRVMINAQFHQEELTKHIHISFSCLKKDGDKISYYKPQMLEAGYGSSLQDDFEKSFHNSINTRFKKHKMNNVYHRGEKKKSYREVGNDHTNQADFGEQVKAVQDITNTLVDENLSTVEMLKHIRGLKSIYKANRPAIQFLNIFQRGFKKMNEEQIQMLNTKKVLDSLVQMFGNDLESAEDIINFIKETPEVAKPFIEYGGEKLLRKWGVKKTKDKMVMIPTPQGNQNKLVKGKIETGSRIDFQKQLANLSI
jgi:hypothetical protein